MNLGSHTRRGKGAQLLDRKGGLARPGSSGQIQSPFFIKECSSGHEDGPSVAKVVSALLASVA
uniref:Uncharacterized protein n=2 Tax=Cucumis melo TaxID=3656 RepID=A0A9I9CCY1_CUCME